MTAILEFSINLQQVMSGMSVWQSISPAVTAHISYTDGYAQLVLVVRDYLSVGVVSGRGQVNYCCIYSS